MRSLFQGVRIGRERMRDCSREQMPWFWWFTLRVGLTPAVKQDSVVTDAGEATTE